MAYKLTLNQGDKVIIKINGKWIEGIIHEVSKHKYMDGGKDNYISLHADRYRMVIFPGDSYYHRETNLHFTVIKKVS